MPCAELSYLTIAVLVAPNSNSHKGINVVPKEEISSFGLIDAFETNFSEFSVEDASIISTSVFSSVTTVTVTLSVRFSPVQFSPFTVYLYISLRRCQKFCILI